MPADEMRSSTSQRLLPVLGVLVLTVAVLYWARQLVIPLALAVLLAFLLAPLVNMLQRWRLPRLPAVLLVVVLVLALFAGLLRIIVNQLGDLSKDLQKPEYTQAVAHKIEELRNNKGYIWNQVGEFMQAITRELQQPAPAGQEGEQPVQVIFRKEAMSALSLFPIVASTVLETLLTIVFVIVLVVFILMRHEDLRDRLIQLSGRGQMALTTTALDEAGERIGKLMLRQLGVNLGFGVLFWTGLSLIGVPYAFLWGVLAALLRFVPYIGSAVAVCFPLALSFAVFPGWFHPLYVLGLFLCLELFTAYLVEPLFFSDTAGASPIALLVAAAFWTWLWGPVGLILSNPMTVCLVVLGRYVPQLKFFDILMSPHVELPPPARYYNRLLARNRDEATELLEEVIHQRPEEEVYDQFLIPSLVLAKEDYLRGEITTCQEQDTLQAMRDIFEGTLALQPALDTPPEGPNGERPRAWVLGCPARDAGDALALRYFSHVMQTAGVPVEISSPDKLCDEVVEQVKAERPPSVFLVAVAPGGLSELQYYCKRLRARAPRVKIVVGWWGHADDRQKVRESLIAAGAQAVSFSLLESRDQLKKLLPAAREKLVAAK